MSTPADDKRLDDTGKFASARRPGMPDALALRLQQALAELAQLRRELAQREIESNAARQQSDDFTDTISRLQRIVHRLEQEVAQAHYFAFHDALTGLPNRMLLRDRLNQALIQAERQRKQVGLLLIDLDDFKSVNDRFGHAAGDQILWQVAQRLISGLRSEDTACRYGGDEFVVLLPESDVAGNVQEVAQKLRARLNRPYTVDDHSISMTASIGVAVYPGDARCEKDLIRRADLAMYLAKARAAASMQST